MPHTEFHIGYGPVSVVGPRPIVVLNLVQTELTVKKGWRGKGKMVWSSRIHSH